MLIYRQKKNKKKKKEFLLVSVKNVREGNQTRRQADHGFDTVSWLTAKSNLDGSPHAQSLLKRYIARANSPGKRASLTAVVMRLRKRQNEKGPEKLQGIGARQALRISGAEPETEEPVG